MLLIAVLSGLTWRRARVYESPVTLWTDTLARNPEAGAAHHNLGRALAAQGRDEEAADHFRHAPAGGQ